MAERVARMDPRELNYLTMLMAREGVVPSYLVAGPGDVEGEPYSRRKRARRAPPPGMMRVGGPGSAAEDSATGPLPDYFRSRANREAIKAVLSGGASLFGAGIAGLDPEPWGKTVGAALALANAGYAANSIRNSRNLRRAAEMWSRTGLPQAPTNRSR